jgi:hypothetical protein
MVSIFANIRINDPERLEHLKDSFFSFSAISDNWVINVRGKLREEAIAFLKNELKEKAVFFELLDDNRGWIKNALTMMPAVKYEYVLLWNEDHINILSTEKTMEILKEAIHARVDYLHYGHHEHWRRKFDQNIQNKIIKRGNSIDFVDLTKKNLPLFFPQQRRECITSSPAIFRKKFLIRIMKIEGRKLPFFLTHTIRRIIALIGRISKRINQKRAFDILNNILFFHKLPRFEKQTPFELEITQDRFYILPVRVASSHEEFFVCIDDDINKDGSMDGYQLIKRGLYPVQNLLVLGRETPPNARTLYTIALSKGEKFSDRYYINQIRTYEPLRALLVSTGDIEVHSGQESVIVKDSQSVRFYPNIQHTIVARENVSVTIYILAPHELGIVHPGDYIYS